MSAHHPDIRRTLLFLVRDGELLIARKKRGFGVGKWNGVGGKLEPAETVEQAMIRECQEEIEVTPLSYWPVAELDFLQDADIDDPWHMYVYAYLCDEWEGTPVETEEMAPEWVSVDSIPFDKMWADDKFWLQRVLAGELIKASFTFDSGDSLTSSNIVAVEKLPL